MDSLGQYPIGIPTGLPAGQYRERQGQRGMNDGLARSGRVSDDPDYADAYTRGERMAMAGAGELVLALNDGAVCDACGVTFFGFVECCACKDAATTPLRRGLFGLYGPDVLDDPARFLSYQRLRALIGMGVRVVAADGNDITGDIPVVQ